MSNTQSPARITLTVELAELLLKVVDGENAATKNRLVSAVLSDGTYADHAPALAQTSAKLTLIRSAVQRSLNAAV